MSKKTYDCAKGCSFCCLIRAHVNGEEKDTVMKALLAMPNQDVALQRAEHRSKMDFTLANGLAPCVALGPDGTCQIYESRPETCRTYFSTDKRECEKGAAGEDFDPSVIHNEGRTPHEQLAYIDELYLAQMKGESTEIKEIKMCVAPMGAPLYIEDGDVRHINPIVEKFVDKLPKELGAAVLVSEDYNQFISVTLYSKQIMIEFDTKS